jgi:hypothetical protein
MKYWYACGKLEDDDHQERTCIGPFMEAVLADEISSDISQTGTQLIPVCGFNPFVRTTLWLKYNWNFNVTYKIRGPNSPAYPNA